MKTIKLLVFLLTIAFVFLVSGCPKPDGGPSGSSKDSITFEADTDVNNWISDGSGIAAGIDWGGWGTTHQVTVSTEQKSEGSLSLKSVATLDGTGEDQVEIIFKYETIFGSA